MDKAGLKPEHINCADDLQIIPPVSKSHIQNEYDSFISNSFSNQDCLIRTTSGSSGKMLRVIWDQDNFWSRFSLAYRAFSMIGYSPVKKLVYFLPVYENAGFTFGLFRNLPLSFDRPLEEVIKILIKYKPHILSIYPSYAIDLGKHLTDRDIEMMGIKAISLNSEMILAQEVSRIQDIYKCPVYEEYSSVEIGMIASMCRDRGMHIFSDNVILEILDRDEKPLPPGEVGEVTLTALNSFGMPFIRYRIGDFSSIREETCACGSAFPLLNRIEGRKDDCQALTGGYDQDRGENLVQCWRGQ